MWYEKPVRVLVIKIGYSWKLRSDGIPHYGILKAWGCDDGVNGTAIIKNKNITAYYDFALHDLVADPSILTLPTLPTIYLADKARVVGHQVLPLPWTYEHLVGMEYVKRGKKD